MLTNPHTGTRIDEVAPGIYRINTPLRIDAIPEGFNLSQYLIIDDEPMVFHTGWRKWFPFVSEAISKVIPLDRIRHIGYSHFEGDEAGAMNGFLAAAPHAVPFASHVGVMTSLNDHADRPGRGLADGETFSTGQNTWQAEYVEDFHGAVLAVLAFHPTHADLADRLALAVTDHATPVGSGTVGRTKRIPIERRAEAAVIAWMRHQTTGYDSLVIPRVKGKRREVRRMLARRSHELLDGYRRGEGVADGCPLQKALASSPATPQRAPA
jgi:hypothetical protein